MKFAPLLRETVQVPVHLKLNESVLTFSPPSVIWSHTKLVSGLLSVNVQHILSLRILSRGWWDVAVHEIVLARDNPRSPHRPGTAATRRSALEFDAITNK